MLSIFSHVSWPSVCLFGKMSVQVCPLFDQVGCFSGIVLQELLILKINPLSVIPFAIIFSHSESCLFILLIVSFAVQKLLSLISSHFFVFVLFPLLQEVGQRGCCCDLCQSVLPMSYSKWFIVSGLTFKSLIQFEFIFVYDVKYSNVILLHVAVQFSQHHLLKRLSFLHVYSCLICQR